MNLSEINRIVELMTANDLTEIDIKLEDMSLTIKREPTHKEGTPPQMMPTPVIVNTTAAPEPTTVSMGVAGGVETKLETEVDDGETVDSPLVGTFYTAPSPDANVFVKVGDSVDEDTVVCIIEAMKVMNEIKADVKGTITKIIAENGQPVEFGEPLFLVAT